MTNMERIRDLLDECPAHDGHCTGQRAFLLKAFQVMREVAIREGTSDEYRHRDTSGAVDEEFERLMSQEKEPL